MCYLAAIWKMTEWFQFISKQNIQHHNNPSLCHNHWWWRNWSWMILQRSTIHHRTNTKERCPFHHRGLECKNRKSRDTWKNRQIWSWSTKWSRAKANRVLSREHTVCQENTHFQQHKRRLYTWTSPDGQHWNQIDYILCSQRWRSIFELSPCLFNLYAEYSQQKQELELTLAQIIISLLQNSGSNWRK